MTNNIFPIFPKNQLTSEKREIIDSVGGKLFSNGEISIDFKSIKFVLPDDDPLVKMKLTHLGYSSVVYFKETQLNAILSLEIKYFSPAYISYLISRKLSYLGFSFVSLLGVGEVNSVRDVIKVRLSKEELSMDFLVDIEGLEVDLECLTSKRNNLSLELKFPTSYRAFYTELSAEELRDLSVDDIVFIYPK